MIEDQVFLRQTVTSQLIPISKEMGIVVRRTTIAAVAAATQTVFVTRAMLMERTKKIVRVVRKYVLLMEMGARRPTIIAVRGFVIKHLMTTVYVKPHVLMMEARATTALQIAVPKIVSKMVRVGPLNVTPIRQVDPFWKTIVTKR